MAKYNFVNISYSQKDNVLVLNENVEEIINEQAMYGFKLSHIINLEIGMFGPTKIKLIFEKEKLHEKVFFSNQ